MSRKSRKQALPAAPRLPAAEELLIAELPRVTERRILCTSLGRGQFADAAARQSSDVRVLLHFLDSYLADEARNYVTLGNASPSRGDLVLRDGAGGGTVDVVCQPDFPDETFELAAIAVDPRGEAELTRDLLQSAHDRLIVGGRLLAAVSNPDDQWLHGEMRKLFAKVTRRPTDRGVLYLATKTEALAKHKNFACEFAFRDGQRLIHLVSRPGVFSHRSLDSGARALINTMPVRAGSRVLDIGCGCGAVGIAAGLRAEGVEVVSLDSNVRAIECTQRGAALNGLDALTARLTSDGDSGAPGTFDVALGNPPYYSDYRIASIFLDAARRALKPQGSVMMVTKTPAWFEEHMAQFFGDVHSIAHKAYTVVRGEQRR